MRLERLDLKPFGHFADHSLEFPQTGLAIVYGLNGAGKSTLRRAISDLLFGMPVRSPDVWKFQAGIRVGALISGLDGDGSVEIVRHKGRKDTLKTPDGEVLDDSIFDAVLGGLTRERFESLYSITQEELRRGGEELVSGKGELASLVFSAGLGSTQVSTLLSSLEEEADALYKDKGRNQIIATKLREYSGRRAEASEKLVLPDEWSRKEQELKRAESERQQVRDEIAEVNTALARKRRHVELKPMLLEHSQLLEDERAIEVPDAVSAGTRTKREAAQEALRRAEEDSASAEKELKRIDQSLTSLDINESLMAAAAEIEKLAQDAGAIQKAVSDETKLIAQQEAAEVEIAASLEDLGGDRTEAEAVKMMPSAVQEAEILRLSGEFKELVRTGEQECSNIRTLEEEVAGRQSELDQLGEEEDGERISQVGQAARAEGPLEDDLDSLIGRRAGLEKELDQGLKNLFGFSGGLERFRSLEIPIRQAIKKMESRLAELLTTMQQVTTKLSEVEGELEERRASLQTVSGSGSVPSISELEEARSFRQRGWQAVLAAWESGDSGPGEEFAPNSPLPEAYERSVQRADELSDELREKAEKVTQIVSLEADISKLEGRVDRLREERKNLEDAKRDFDQDWRVQWDGSGIEPSDPTTMLEWTEEVRDLKKLITEIDQTEVQIEDKEKRVDFHRAELEAVLGGGNSPGADSESGSRRLGALLNIARRKLEEINKVKNARTAIITAREESKRRLGVAKSAQRKADDRLEQLREEWTPLTVGLSSAEVSGPDAVLEILNVLKELKAKQKVRDNLAKRIDSIKRDVSEFVDSVNDVVLRADVEVDSVDRKNVATVVRELHRQVSVAQQDKQKVEALQESRGSAIERKRRAEENLDSAGTNLADLLEEAGANTVQDLVTMEDAFLERSEKTKARAALERQILQAGGEALQEVAHQVEGLDVDRLSAEIIDLEAEVQIREQRLAELDEVITEIRVYQTQADQTGDALLAANAADQLANELRDDIEEYAKLRIAIEMLKSAMASYREEAEGPVLKRASELFLGMTGEVFQGLETIEGEDGEPVLVARRVDELPTLVSQLSDGERDALYLSFRVASIEYQVEKLEETQRVPIVLDDVFVSMDDERARIGLEFMAQLSRSCQVIFLTHHEHVTNLVRESLPADAFSQISIIRPLESEAIPR